MKQPALFVVALISAFALSSMAAPALAQDVALDQYGTEPPPAGEGEAVVAEGTIQKQGITTYQYGTHVLLDDGGDLLFALQSDIVSLDAYVGERVTIRGTRVPGYQDGAVEGGPDLLDVTSVEEGSTAPPADDDTGGPDKDAPGTVGPGSDDPEGAGSAAADGLLPDTGGAPVPWLLTVAALLSGAILIRRIVR